jgi:YidC/Oxa1 family membrane protein insertase
MNGIYAFFSLMNIHNVALAIFVFTFITKMLMLPLTIKQQKFSKLSSIINPEIQKIQAKYKGKKDEASLRKQQEEIKLVYQKYGTSQASGCLPLLITLPIMFALYRVINNIPDYVNLINEQYNIVAEAIRNGNLLGELAESFKTTAEQFADNSKIIDVLATFKSANWKEWFDKLPQAQDAINYIRNANSLFGLSIADMPSWKSVSVIIPILAAGLQFVQSKQISVKPKDKKDENAGPNPMGTMNVVMPIMSGFFCLILPIGVGLYWIASSIFTIIQQFFINRYLDKKGIDKIVEENLKKATGKDAKKPASATSMHELARKQTKSIDYTSQEKSQGKNKEGIKEQESDKPVDDSEELSEESYKPTSISEIANILKNRNIEKGDK